MTAVGFTCRHCRQPLPEQDALPGMLHFACAARLSLALASRPRKTDTERLREATAILSEVLGTPGVPGSLRRVAAAWLQERQDHILGGYADEALKDVKPTGKGGST